MLALTRITWGSLCQAQHSSLLLGQLHISWLSLHYTRRTLYRTQRRAQDRDEDRDRMGMVWQDKAPSLEQRSWKHLQRPGCRRGCGRADVGNGRCRALQAGLLHHLNANCLLIPAPNHAFLVAQQGGWQQETI